MTPSDLAQERLSALDHWLFEWSCAQQVAETPEQEEAAPATHAALVRPAQQRADSPLLVALAGLADEKTDVPASVHSCARALLQALKRMLDAARAGDWPAESTQVLLDAVAGDDVEATAAQKQVLELCRWWLLGLLASLVHARALDEILTATRPLSESMIYWGWRNDRHWLAGLSLVQTAPQRVHAWTTGMVHHLRQQPASVVPQSFGAYVRHFIVKLPRWPTQGLIARAQREAELKRNNLSDARRRRAVALGYLAERGMRVTSSVRGITVTSGTTTPGSIGSVSALLADDASGVDQVRAFCTELVHCTAQAMEFVTHDNEKPSERKLNMVHAPQQLLGVKETHAVLRVLEESFRVVRAATTRVLHANGRPSFLTRYWPMLGAGLLLGPWAAGTLFSYRYSLRDWVRELGTTTRQFLFEWVWRPVRDIYETVRHREPRLAIMGKASLSSDLESLERMVVDLAREGGTLSERELAIIARNVRDGDLSVVLRQYETEMKTPLKSALFDNLIRVLLIQVQKSKVDLELAMTALDKLLHANELNFAFLTAAPVLLVTYGVTRWLSSLWRRRRGLSAGTAHQEARIWLRRTERLLNQHNRTRDVSEPFSAAAGQHLRSQHGELPHQAHGLILCNTHSLRDLVPRLALAEELQRELLADLREIEDARWTTAQRLGTIGRMYRTYAFLLPARA
ncbi:ATP synthase regulation protein NCA2-domain-containing protein [Thamnocephalis sphaerospora]|uniref:ATP synthase regulation protein NCA2-domain-containing protein n=1 Tax=Thamnocephalis sphaerospora TaxID=78915 RepID=A0A4P9XM19_9FUNG|nr:ATP synthase regulation protein NCA2-domain-containing protein [Thamnocephalis sphaerospora]|eukprot:RKP06882.1 ATP synthase regulation protein NCA2-domain-containing protein [Thamnocephalis sphaerospora]